MALFLAGRLAASAAVLAASGVAAQAATIIGTEFQVSATIDGEALGPAAFTAVQSPDRDNFDPEDFAVSLGFGPVDDFGFFANSLLLDWVDEDTFDVSLRFLEAVPFSASIALDGLRFTEGGAPVDVSSVVLDRAGSRLDEFDAVADFSLDGLATTADSATVSFSSASAALTGDGPVLRFDVGAGAPPPPPIPLPASLPLLAGAAAALAALRLSRRRRS